MQDVSLASSRIALAKRELAMSTAGAADDGAGRHRASSDLYGGLPCMTTTDGYLVHRQDVETRAVINSGSGEDG